MLSWQAPEFFYYKKTSTWYASVVTLAVVIMIVMRLLSILDWTNGLLVVAALFALIRLAGRPPRTIQIKIEDRGVQIGDSSFTFEQLSGFHLTNHGSHITLDFQTKNSLFPVSAVITNQDPEQIRETVGRYLPEKTTGLSYIADTLGRWIHF